MTASAWTDDRVGRLKTLWIEGYSAEQIARALANGITRNAVLGKVHRMGLSAGRSGGSTRAPTTPGPRPSPTPSDRPVARVSKGALPTGLAAATVPESGRATLQSVGRHDCRWPLGDPGAPGFTLCGDQVCRGAYCGPHAEIAYRPARDTPQSLERLARLT